MALSCTNPIHLTYLNGTGYVFDAEDYMRIRTEYRIVGALVGTWNHRGWTPGLNGLPAEFNHYETQLLLEKGYAILLNKSESILKEPDRVEVENYKEFLENRIKEQEKYLKDEKISETKKHMNKILIGKKEKLEKQLGTEDVKLTEEDILNEIKDNFKVHRDFTLLDIPYKHTLEHEGRLVTNLNSSIANPIHYSVFKYFWEHGKYITSGESFGADFIIYPGDPLMFHASHIIIILGENPKINPLEIISKCRLSVTINKKCVFAYLNNQNELSFQTVEWKNFKSNDDNKVNE